MAPRADVGVSVSAATAAKLRTPGGARGVLQADAGADVWWGKGIGLAIEVGPRFEDFSLTRLDDVVLALSTQFGRQVGSSARRRIFGAVGYAFAWEPVPDGQNTHLLSAGIGVQLPLGRRRSLRLEARDAVTLSRPDTGYHYAMLRASLRWRRGA